MSKPNIIYIFADQWRKQAVGYRNEDPVVTPNIDQFAGESLVFENALSCTPLCSPHRAALLTGKYPQSNGVYTNCKIGADVMLSPEEVCIGDVLKQVGYDTGYIGKWHLDLPEENVCPEPASGARGWDAYTPPGLKRHGFDFWYSYGAYDNHLEPHYWKDNANMISVKQWSLEHETDVALEYIQKHCDNDNPFALFVSWNPPHSPFELVPETYKAVYADRPLKLRPNVQAESLMAHTGEPFDSGMENLERYTRDYFAAITGLDQQFGRILDAVRDLGIEGNTLIVLSSDHGELMGSHGLMAKHSWHEESVGIPCLMRWPGQVKEGRTSLLFNSVDIMPTLLGLAEIPIPSSVEGRDFSNVIIGQDEQTDVSSAFLCAFPGRKEVIEQFAKQGLDNRKYGWRAVRTHQYTYVIHRGYEPGEKTQRFLYDLKKDPYQLDPLIVTEASSDEVTVELERELQAWLLKTGDRFELY
ncbi:MULTISPECIES: sulfatase family protein [unclassified Paenibacillus]|uniref:sulfatase family protein n=1 Tax=unclassified Paenibacillus TaxID=185978 RepID=UPI0036259867